jgi:hypothetical protein
MSTTFHQAALPPGWHLADEAILPGGRPITGTAARVYNLLVETRRHAHRWNVGRHLAPPGWVPTWVLREPWAGGSAGDRRLRDLREEGLAIESERFVAGAAGDNAPDSASWLWRLASPTAAAAGAPAISPAAPLQGLTVRFVATPAGAIDISPGASSHLAPSFAACDDAAYRSELLQAFHAGRLLASFTGRQQWSLWADPAAAYDPRPVLQTALSKLGATIQGAFADGP